jgi:3-oxoacyl-[acyl-carrier-protein] synthase-3
MRGHDQPGLSFVVDVFGLDGVFECIDNQRVLELSRLGGNTGFSGTANIRKSTGISTRRILDKGMTVLDLAECLCRRLEDESGTALKDFDAVLLCHSHTDPTACSQLAAALTERMMLPAGLIDASCFGCAGYLKLLQEGTLVLNDLGPMAKVALLTIETPELWHDAADRLFCGIVSAGATANVLEFGKGLPIDQIRADDFLMSDAEQADSQPLFYKETADVYCFRGTQLRRKVMRMNAAPVFVNGIELMLDNLRSALISIDRPPGQRIVVVPHQPSGKLLKALVASAHLEFPDIEFLNNLDGYGNTISSSIPTIVGRLAEVVAANQLAPLQDGDRLILLAAGICMSKIPDHMSAGHACLTYREGMLNSKLSDQPSEAASVVR